MGSSIFFFSVTLYLCGYEEETVMDLDQAAAAFREFVSIIKALRTPGTGCPWDLEQDHRSLRPYVIEETYEVVDAIDDGDDQALQEELGDLLLQAVLHAQVAADRSAFSITEVVQGIADKMVRRHPHVFGSTQVSGSADVVRNWEALKAAEKGEAASPLASIPRSLPALLRAQRLGEKSEKMGAAARVGDEQLRTSFAALEASFEKHSKADIEQNLGKFLFDLCQRARQAGVNAEERLQAMNQQFVETVQS
jgi:MazG family protein